MIFFFKCTVKARNYRYQKRLRPWTWDEAQIDWGSGCTVPGTTRDHSQYGETILSFHSWARFLLRVESLLVSWDEVVPLVPTDPWFQSDSLILNEESLCQSIGETIKPLVTKLSCSYVIVPWRQDEKAMCWVEAQSIFEKITRRTCMVRNTRSTHTTWSAQW